MKTSEELYSVAVDISEDDVPTVAILRRSLGEGPDVVVRILHGEEALDFKFRYLSTTEEKLISIGETLKKVGDNCANAQFSIYKLIHEIEKGG